MTIHLAASELDDKVYLYVLTVLREELQVAVLTGSLGKGGEGEEEKWLTVNGKFWHHWTGRKCHS